MPYQIQVGSQVVEFPDSVGQDEAQRILSEQFPATGEDIAGAMQDPAYKPSVDDYLKYEEYSKNKQTDWINTIAQSVDAAAGMIGGAISQGAQGAAANPLNYIEGAAQGTRQLYGLVAQSQDPASPLFKFKDLVAGTGTPESRYNQFLEARDFANTTARLERGEEGLFVPPELTNPEFVQGVSMILDPTLALPGIGEVFGAGKLATRAVGKGTQLAGRAIAGAAKPLERVAGAAERMTAEALGMAPEALRNTAATAGIAGALGIAPEAAAFAAIPAGIRTAREGGEALARAGENLMTQPSRVGPLEAIGAAPGANLRQRMLGVVGQYGGDAALDASLRSIAGGIEGAAVGAGLGFLSGGEEGAAAGLGTGAVQGAAGALGARGFERLTGKAAKDARAGDLGRFIDAQQDPTTKTLFERVRDTHGVDAASALMDLQGLVRGKFGDVDILYRSNAQMAEKFGNNIRGVQFEQAERPTIFINADIIGKGTGDGPLYTLGHELFHALEKTTQLEGGATEIKDALVGRWVQEGDITRKLAEGAFNDAEIEAKFNEYRDKLAAGNQQRADQLAQYDTIDKKAGYVASELAAEHFAGLLAGQKPDALLKGFTGITRQLLDSALTQNASRALADAAATIERTFGVKPTDSVLFPDLKQASPQVNAMLRDLVRARRKLDERITMENEGPARVLKPQDVSNPIAAKQLVDLGVAEQMPDGSVRNLTDEEVRAREEKDTTALRNILESIPGARVVDGEVQGRFSPDQLSAIEQSQAVSSRMKDKIRAVNAAMQAGNSLFLNYGAATRRVKNRLTGKYTSKYSSGIKLSQREVLPYSFYLSKADNPVIKAIDISKIRGALDKLTAPDGSVAAGLWDNVDGFMSDLAAYFTNLDAGEGARRSAEIFGLEKAKFLGDFVNEQEKGGRKFVRDFRLDRIGSTAPMDFRARISEDAIQKSKMRWMPAETVGDKSVINSEEGYRIISGAKHRLYGPDGNLIGIYDTQTQAERKADATQTRLQPEVRQQQYPARDEVRQTAAAGRGDSAVGRTQGREEGRQELGAVRQAGDVITPESPEVVKKVVSGDTSALKDGELLGTFRFMPPDLIDKLAVTDEQRQAMRGKSGFAFVSDWADAGRPYVTRLGRKIDVLMGGMGYPFLPEISGKGAWAGTFSGMTDTVMKKIKATDGIGLVVLGGPESSASSRAFSRAFGEELADSMSQNPKLKEKLDKIARNARKQWIEYRRGEGKSIDVPEINSLEDWARLTQLERAGEQSERGLTFNDRDFLVRTIGSHDNKKALGIRSWKDVLRNYNLQNKDFTPGQVVAVVQFSGAEPVRAETVGAKVHPSYEALIPGKAIGTLPQKTMIKDVFRDFLSKTQPPAFTRKIQTNMPKFVVGEGDMRFMPSDTDYLSAVQQGDTQAAQRMVDEAAKAAGYTIGPVYHGTPTGGFNVFDKRMRGETSGVSRQAFSFTTDKKAAEGYSKRLGDEAVRLDAGLRVANDAMRRFDDDMAAQEYFSSKGYSSVEDGMLPEFDWGSIDDVPEFIKELRGHAKDLKPINADLASSFVEAAKVMASTKAVPEVKRVFLRIPENAPVFQATPATLGQVMSGFSAEKQPTKAGIVELPGNERIYYVADSSQVKLADPVTKDAQGNVIPLSQRFKATSEDIRYMPATSQREVGRNVDFANPPTEEKAKAALSSSKQPFWREHESLPEGSPVGVRIDIPAFLNRGTYVQTIHEPATPGNVGDRIGYDTNVRLSGPVRFFVKEGSEESKLGAVAIKEGRATKHPIATVEGRLIKDRSIPSDIETWTPVGMDPEKHSYFYDKRTDQPVTGGSESFSVGNTVFVKNPVYGKPQDFRYMPAGDMASGRSVKDHREAMDLFEKGYRLYGALYDGMEDPVRLKKATEIERFDPENLWAVPPRRVAAAIAIRNMPADMMPQPDSSMPGAYTFTGGYRAIPGKTKGSFRLYGPAGSLIGIASSLDEAQRILRRKAKQ